MATINIFELHPVGAELFHDSETFLNELNDQEIRNIEGGQDFLFLSNGSVALSVGAQTANGNSINANTVGLTFQPNANTAAIVDL